ncbi:stage II sporulation protein M [Tuberibacillus calidus]|uniref:stage II sporulation protein M n=1 Tax=Tuberibacillus calidus TaxID=340097 RepID=UPI00138AFAB3
MFKENPRLKYKYLIFLLVFYLPFIIILTLAFNVNGIPRKIACTQDIFVTWNEVFVHNIGVALITIVLGLCTLGFSTLFVVLFNYYSIFIAFNHTNSFTRNLGDTFLVFSHLWTEVLGMCISYYLSLLSLQYVTNRFVKKNLLPTEGIRGITLLFAIMITLFLISSILETTISLNAVTKYCK